MECRRGLAMSSLSVRLPVCQTPNMIALQADYVTLQCGLSAIAEHLVQTMFSLRLWTELSLLLDYEIYTVSGKKVPLYFLP